VVDELPLDPIFLREIIPEAVDQMISDELAHDIPQFAVFALTWKRQSDSLCLRLLSLSTATPMPGWARWSLSAHVYTHYTLPIFFPIFYWY
jgi:hypothetical protein